MSIRVLHIVTTMNRGGLETMIMNYYRNIDKSKIQFDFIEHRQERSDYDDEIEKLGGKIYRVSPLVPWSRAYKNELRQIFKEHPEYKIVHIHQDCLSSVALRVAKECGIPIRIAHAHSTSQDKNFKFLIKKYYMRSIPKYSTSRLACGNEAGQWMFSGADFEVLNNAIETDNYCFNKAKSKKIRQEIGINNQLVVGHVGRFCEPKNHPFLIDIFIEILKIEPNSKLVLVGDGDNKAEIESMVKQLVIDDKVIFTGVRSDVQDLLQAMDVFLFPSLYEGLPVTMVEAQAAGLPCVISDKVPSECIKTSGLVTIKNLSASANDWAEHILERTKEGKSNHQQELIENGFDIKENAKWLQEFYLSKVEDK